MNPFRLFDDFFEILVLHRVETSDHAHKRVDFVNDPIPQRWETRPMRRVDFNRSAMAGFAVAWLGGE
jgi:hypothetical protein